MSIASIAGRLIGAAVPYRLYAELAVAGVLVAAVGAQTWRLHSAETTAAQTIATAEHERAVQVAAALAENEAQRAEFERRTTTIHGIVNETVRIAQEVQADALAARDSRERLQHVYADTLAALARQARGGAAPAAGSAPATDLAGVLADVQRRIDEAAGSYAAAADQRGTAGRACERSYDALGSLK